MEWSSGEETEGEDGVRDAIFTDIFHIPEWRLCAVQGCPGILRSPAFFCSTHVIEFATSYTVTVYEIEANLYAYAWNGITPETAETIQELLQEKKP